MKPDAQVRPASSFTDSSRTDSAATLVPDETALRRVFDQYADSVATNAATQLGEGAHLAPRVVEHVFLNVWRSRSGIVSESALVAFLDEAVRHDSARVLSRRMAARRMGGNDEKSRPAGGSAATPPYDREAVWAQLQRELRGGDSAAAHARAAAVAHHEAAANIRGIARDKGWMRPALTAGAVAACALGGIWLLDHASRGAKLDAAIMASTARTVEASPAQIGSITLDDGSTVRFAPESRIAIPQGFGAGLRGIRVEGAATIAVAPGLSAPLVVKARGATIAAEGTAFMVRGYPTDSVVLVVMTEGRATVKRGEEKRMLAAGEALAIPDAAPMREPTAGEREEAMAWTENRLVVRDRRLADILPEFQRWYNMKIYAADPRIHDRRVSVRASLDSVRQAIAAVEATGAVTFGYLEDKMIFHEAAAPAAKKPAPTPAAKKPARRR